jgi:hypothetical protein
MYHLISSARHLISISTSSGFIIIISFCFCLTCTSDHITSTVHITYTIQTTYTYCALFYIYYMLLMIHGKCSFITITSIHIYIHKHTHTSTHIFIHTHTHTHTHTHILVHIYTAHCIEFVVTFNCLCASNPQR